MGIIADKLVAEKDLVIERFKSGESCNNLAKEYGCSATIITRFLKKHGINPKRENLYDHRFNEFKELFESGRSIYSMEKELKISAFTIIKILNNGGVDTSRGCKIRKDPIKNHEDEIVRLYEEGKSESEIGKIFDCNASSVSRLLKRRKVNARFLYDVDENFFETIDTEEKAYTLGFFTADGNLTKDGNFCIAITDLDVLEKIRKAMGITSPIRLANKSRNSRNILPIYKLNVQRQKITQDLINKDCPPNKTFVTKFPTLEKVPEHLLVHYIRGVFDGDGSIHNTLKKKHSVRSWTISIAGTPTLLEPMLDFIRSRVDVRGGIYQNGNIQEIKVGGNNQVLAVANWLYANSTIHMNRKFEKYQDLIKQMEQKK